MGPLFPTVGAVGCVGSDNTSGPSILDGHKLSVTKIFV